MSRDDMQHFRGPSKDHMTSAKAATLILRGVMATGEPPISYHADSSSGPGAAAKNDAAKDGGGGMMMMMQRPENPTLKAIKGRVASGAGGSNSRSKGRSASRAAMMTSKKESGDSRDVGGDYPQQQDVLPGPPSKKVRKK
ncbi:hypothetical protein B0T17DRAFT_616147 [Bombardia bombarda]|uniref:Uncharacterized protein n=1 Tax=Bombardia bombarda TaxID=252184 RepID=A0AA40CAH7_9PEZI|nr:hypothetical protein B0T17DRAFT_616147 [Bombardia bombarda]